MIPKLFQAGVKYVLTDRFNQDPLEEHFAKQRSMFGGFDNPTFLQYGETEKKIQITKD